MNIKLERKEPIETKPFNQPCDDWGCKSNLQGYCHGFPTRSRRWVEEPVELDTFRRTDDMPAQWHEEWYCQGYEKRGE